MAPPRNIAKEPRLISHSIAHYLICIHQLLDKPGYVRNIDIAKHLGRTRGTVSVVLKRMSEEGLVVFDENSFIKLTQQGHEITHRMLGSKLAVSKFLHEVLGVPKDVALKDACRIEHHLSRETLQSLVNYLNGIAEQKQPISTRGCGQTVCPDATRCHVCESECLLNFDATQMHSV